MPHMLHACFLERLPVCGLPKCIVSDRCLIHESFLANSLEKYGYYAQIFYGYHSQTDGQTEVANQSLGNLLWCLVGEHLTKWDMVLPVAEFAYNNSINRSTNLSSFEICYKLRKYIYSLPIGDRPSVSA